MPIDLDGNQIDDDRCAVHPDRFEPCVVCDFPIRNNIQDGILL